MGYLCQRSAQCLYIAIFNRIGIGFGRGQESHTLFEHTKLHVSMGFQTQLMFTELYILDAKQIL